MNSSTVDNSVLLNLLTSRQERKDTRVFAHAAAETQIAINDTYQSRPSTRAGHPVNGNPQEPGFLEVFPRVASRPPKLLQEIEAILADRLRSNDKAVSTAPIVTKERDPRMAANLFLDAHRQAFAAFVQGFSTYTPLLAGIQAEFEATLNEGLRCTSENVELRVRIAEEEKKREEACGQVRARIMAGELEYRKAAFARLQELKVRMERAVRRAAAVERDLAAVRSEEERMQGVVAHLRQQNVKLNTLQRAEQVWAALPTSAHVGHMKVGPLTQEDETWLDQEYTGPITTRLPAHDTPQAPNPPAPAPAPALESPAAQPTALQPPG
mmetsp:Transcript_34236/g.75969  ORF Transcript_34236/g.75969 Transcript_34236/m.75969 type:complete len:325 (-) Transcript_34236:581-1555(-)|eukprot:CAMPEP_0202891786 /NCGR_PEP_ID=MMETSP1392-20130828/1759_1 /ASSEMBLY_ACC=CAM_ASM_000868 /TAXON_ID=225041 /ORGANISM="Chlamydomonas chlamydogama, Strain SAG 11-48b" /LENGTH=324 /DNA_ID=CAMNT_0049575639 /DNA_START=285 /DNA_END=1259 /DNA_ORIENTATION=+